MDGRDAIAAMHDAAPALTAGATAGAAVRRALILDDAQRGR
jgi:hypothetical protein